MVIGIGNYVGLGALSFQTPSLAPRVFAAPSIAPRVFAAPSIAPRVFAAPSAAPSIAPLFGAGGAKGAPPPPAPYQQPGGAGSIFAAPSIAPRVFQTPSLAPRVFQTPSLAPRVFQTPSLAPQPPAPYQQPGGAGSIKVAPSSGAPSASSGTGPITGFLTGGSGAPSASSGTGPITGFLTGGGAGGGAGAGSGITLQPGALDLPFVNPNIAASPGYGALVSPAGTAPSPFQEAPPLVSYGPTYDYGGGGGGGGGGSYYDPYAGSLTEGGEEVPSEEAPAAEGGILSKIPWWGWVGAAGAAWFLFFRKKGRR